MSRLDTRIRNTPMDAITVLRVLLGLVIIFGACVLAVGYFYAGL